MSDSLTVRLKDFPDRFSPMLVKELRQGLRARAFVTIFLVLQALLALILLSAVGAATASQVGETVSQIIFFFLALALLIFQPLRGVTAVSSEIKANTLEIMSLTRLGSWRIVTGKWTAIVSQSALLVTAIVPYLILRYFLGGMQLFAELLLLVTLLIGSAALTAVTVGISANRGVLVRTILPILGIPFGFFVISGLVFGFGMNRLVEFFSLSTTESRGIYAGIVFFLGYFGWLSLDFGASMIAPRAENRATRRRAVGLALSLPLIALILFTDVAASPALALLFLAPLVLVSLAEPMELTTPVIRRFTRHGWIGRLMGRIFYPGWASGTVFSAILIVMLGGALVFGVDAASTDPDWSMAISAVVGILAFPAVLLLAAQKWIRQRFNAYLIALVSSGILALVVSILSDSLKNDAILWAFVWVPPVAWALYDEVSNTGAVVTVATAFAMAYFTILLVAALLAFRQVRQLEREVSAEPAEPKAEA